MNDRLVMMMEAAAVSLVKGHKGKRKKKKQIDGMVEKRTSVTVDFNGKKQHADRTEYIR